MFWLTWPPHLKYAWKLPRCLIKNVWFCSHWHIWKMSQYLVNNIEHFQAYKCCNAASNSGLSLKISGGLALLMQGEEASAQGYKMFLIAQEIFAHPESLWLRSMNLKRHKWRETGLKSQETGIFWWNLRLKRCKCHHIHWLYILRAVVSTVGTVAVKSKIFAFCI